MNVYRTLLAACALLLSAAACGGAPTPAAPQPGAEAQAEREPSAETQSSAQSSANGEVPCGDFADLNFPASRDEATPLAPPTEGAAQSESPTWRFSRRYSNPTIPTQPVTLCVAESFGTYVDWRCKMTEEFQEDSCVHKIIAMGDGAPLTDVAMVQGDGAELAAALSAVAWESLAQGEQQERVGAGAVSYLYQTLDELEWYSGQLLPEQLTRVDQALMWPAVH